MITAHESLVQYSNAVLVSTTKDNAAKKKKQQLPPMERQQLTTTEDFLNSILPPREWTDDGQLWVQYVSSTPATRLDVIKLQEQLDRKLQQRQARESGICPVREDLYTQCFNELIRQITINCAERGLLLLRVRDEIRMTISTYQTTYESAIAFGMRKALIVDHRKTQLVAKVKHLQSEKADLEEQLSSLQNKFEDIQKNEAERQERDLQKHMEKVEKLKQVNLSLRTNLESMLRTPKA